MAKKANDSKLVRLNWVFPPDLQTHFVMNMTVQSQPDHFILSFFEVTPPPIIGETEEEKQAFMDGISSVDAKCVARVVVTPDKMKEFVEVLSQNYAQWKQLTFVISGNVKAG